MKKHLKYNRERLLLTALVAIAFFGFLLWSINETSSEEASLLSGFLKIKTPSENKSIKVTTPKVGAFIKSPVNVLGQTTNQKEPIFMRIKDSSGFTLAKEKMTSENNQGKVIFSARIKYKKPSRNKGVVEIFSLSPKDNSETNKIRIPINFKD